MGRNRFKSAKSIWATIRAGKHSPLQIIDFILTSYFRLPKFDDPIENVFARIGFFSFMTTLIVGSSLFVTFIFSSPIIWVDTTICFVSACVAGYCVRLLYLKRLKTAILIYVIVPYSTALMGALLNFGLENISLHSIYPLIIIASLFLGPRMVNVMGGITVIGLIAMYVLSINGYYNDPIYQLSPLTQLLVSITMLCITLAMCQFAFYQLKRSNREMAAAKEEAEIANRLKSAFLANMSHELRTPLNAIIGYSAGIIDEAQTDDIIDPDYLKDVERIEFSGRHLLALITDILDLAKIEADKVNIHISAVSIPELARELEDLIHPLISSNGNQLLIDVSHDHPPFHSDKSKLKQILLNLLSNSAKFTRGGQIYFTISEICLDESSFFQFEVRDTGIGIPPNKLDTIFDSFEQVDNSLTRGYSGTGLGLAITKKLTEILGGEISVRSVVGVGTTFRLQFPFELDPPAGVEFLTEPIAAD